MNISFFSLQIPFQLQTLTGGALDLSSTPILPFISVITYGGRLSDHYVGGTDGVEIAGEHGPFRVLIPSAVLTKNIHGLEGRSVFATNTLDTHDRGVSVGEFISAWVEASSIEGEAPLPGEQVLAAKSSGLLERLRNPDLIAKIVTLARETKLGFSYDLTDVVFTLEVHQGERYIRLQEFQWLGATILYKDAAAYELTQLAAAKRIGGKKMAFSDDDKKEIGTIIAGALKPEFDKLRAETLGPLEKKVTDGVNDLSKRLEAVETRQDTFEAALEGHGDGDKNKDKNKDAAPLDKALEKVGESMASAVGKQFEKLNDTLKTMSDKLDKVGAVAEDKKKESIKHTRKTLGATQIQWMEKYADVKTDDHVLAPGDFDMAIKAIGASKAISKHQRISMIDQLRASKLAILRSEQQSVQ